MPRFVTIGYGDQAGYDATNEKVLKAAHANDAELVRQGAIIGIAGDAAQVRNHDAAGREVRKGAYMRSELPIAGFAIIEADDLDAAIAKVAKSPCAVAQGVIEVWPLIGPDQS